MAVNKPIRPRAAMKFHALAPIAFLALSAGGSAAQSQVPTGQINIESAMVRNGARPLVSWSINYPKPLEEVVTIDDAGEIEIKERSEVEIRVVGVAFQSGATLHPALLQAEINGTWSTLFEGTSDRVNPSETIFKQVLEPGDTLNFSARGAKARGGWSFAANTLSDNPQVTHLREGQTLPQYVPADNQKNIADYLTSFFAPDGTLTVGPRDVVYLFEIGRTDTDSRYFNMQDVAVVVTFKDVENH